MAHSSEDINTLRHPFVGVTWPVTGSRGDTYQVEMVDSGFDCSCIAFVKCKHIREVEDKILGKKMQISEKSPLQIIKTVIE